MITGISGFVFVQKWPFGDAHLFSKVGLLKPLFLLYFLGRVFWAKMSE